MKLTDKEIQVLQLKKKGLTQVEIAERLGISQPAVSGFYTNAMRKIDAARYTLNLYKRLGGDSQNTHKP